MKRLIRNGPLFDGHVLHKKGAILIDGEKITRVFTQTDEAGVLDAAGCQVIDAKGCLIMPGLVDLHSDSLERSIEKRKGVFFDIDFAILNLDRHLAACGITSFCHAISFADEELGLRAPEQARKCIEQIKAFNRSGQALVKHNTHIRYEVGSVKSLEIILELLDQGLVDLVSIMDHTPGQGQFKSMQSYVNFHATEYGLGKEEILVKAAEKQSDNARAWKMVAELTRQVSRAGIPMLSHDDDTAEKVDLIRDFGIRASEFPVTLAAAARAIEKGLSVFMGAPNLIRNQSTNGNLKASDALAQGVCTGLVSDYYPESLCQAPFMAAGAGFSEDLSRALAAVTSGPGSFLQGAAGAGELRPGTDADIIIINREHNWAHITHTLVKGHLNFHIQERQSDKGELWNTY